jgi:hypothetical protein
MPEANPSNPMFSPAEREAIVLSSVMGIIDDMVNHAIFSFPGSGATRQPFPTDTTAKSFFALRLSDFLSQTDRDIGIEPIPYVRHLIEICDNPFFGDVTGLRTVVEKFRNWLAEKKTFTKIWLPTLDIETSLTPSRLSWLKVAGNLQKHDALRSAGTAKDIAAWLTEACKPVGHMDVLAAIEDFRAWLNEDAFSAYIVPIAYWLNELRWETFEYLKPYFRANYVSSWDDRMGIDNYSYRTDSNVTAPFARGQRHDLLNWVRNRPIVERFSIDDVWHNIDRAFSSR